MHSPATALVLEGECEGMGLAPPRSRQMLLAASGCFWLFLAAAGCFWLQGYPATTGQDSVNAVRHAPEARVRSLKEDKADSPDWDFQSSLTTLGQALRLHVAWGWQGMQLTAAACSRTPMTSVREQV